MKPPLVALLLVVALPPTAASEDRKTPERAEVLVLGTYHMDNPGRDWINPPADDVLTEQRQAEIEDLVARLKRFEPTHVAVERAAGEQAQLDRWYRAYVEAQSSPSRDEVYQVGFRLAAEMNHERLYAVDHPRDLAMPEVIEYARAHQPRIAGRFDEEIERIGAFMDELMERPILEIFRVMNTPDPETGHGLYMLSAQVGSAADPIGARVTADWHARNLEIFGSVARLAETGKERIVVLIGAGHAPLLRAFVEWSPNLRLADTLEVLR